MAEWIIPIVVASIAAAGSLAAAWISSRTRRENAEQHGASQQLLGQVALKVDEHGRKLDSVADRVEAVASRVDHAHTRLDNHKPQRRWFR